MATHKDKGGAAQRVRERWFGERDRLGLRLKPDLRDKLTAASAAAGTTTKYVETILSLAVAGELSAKQLQELEWFDDFGEPGERLQLSIRVHPKLLAEVRAEAKHYEVTINKYVCFVLNLALKERG